MKNAGQEKWNIAENATAMISRLTVGFLLITLQIFTSSLIGAFADNKVIELDPTLARAYLRKGSHSSFVYLAIKLTEEVARDKQSCFFFRKQVWRIQRMRTILLRWLSIDAHCRFQLNHFGLLQKRGTSLTFSMSVIIIKPYATAQTHRICFSVYNYYTLCSLVSEGNKSALRFITIELYNV
ncbi:hypothetical protein Bca52824_089674 [Brassica carinata]|uniref:Uncharacterized protein n=1 Tax=Brassica carinata TaxID=52824 RepID=A0A8X7PDP9_BRACI|nr:hypothetical protein Bca52824_089674 [Brassica carinata]